MKICVCIKHVPDTAANIKLAGEQGFEDSECKFVVNPYDEYGLEESVSLVEKNGGEVVVVTVGKEAATATIRSAMAMGAHRAILVKTEGQFLDSALTCKALKAAIEKDGTPDIIFTGKGSVDTEGFQTQYRLAAALGIPVVNEVSKLTVDGSKAVMERETGSGEREVVEMTLPGIIGATKGLNEPRYPKFPDIMKAKKKPIDVIPLSDLGIDEGAGKSVLVKLEATPERSGAKMLEGSVTEQVAQLVKILKEEEKVI
ncbi:Electron transfer flavoprotein alpha/beta-subunit [Desulfamplus magnetovallimortis]|uniref:Electron transfer flavoprotein alpha/beta-subunit n=1 Tax=Desulfamplus magnetovallimortis TaxID=1246637 RepID=A0A1W1HGF9_9BACT|nr:electron transfer flavoprotein subunit beta/FixA family protein [Desulfamplus magnetovallimortis]SLM31472.1 Electron transfer flavoprotein alpha/beta-subunit [Desulfamplus magnetovallimortis]